MREVRIGVVAAGVVLALAGCAASAVRPSATPTVRTDAGLAASTLRVPAALDAAPFDTARTVKAPRGWTVSVWARLDRPRLELWMPDGRLLVSRPAHGDVIALTPRAHGSPTQTTLVSGLDQPHGLASRKGVLYVAESDRVDAYPYAAGRVGARSTVLGGLPDAKSPELHGAYAHALKSVAVAADGRLYVSVGSTGNISADDRTATLERATILTVAPGASTATV